MIDEADDRLRSWAEEAVPDVELCFDVPGSHEARPSLSMYLTRIAPAAPQRSTRRNPLDLELHYLVTAWAESTAVCQREVEGGSEELAKDAIYRKRFEREIRALSKLQQELSSCFW